MANHAYMAIDRDGNELGQTYDLQSAKAKVEDASNDRGDWDIEDASWALIGAQGDVLGQVV